MDKPEAPLFGDSLFIDESDRAALDELPALERDKILNDRHEILVRYREQLELYKRYNPDEKRSSSKRKFILSDDDNRDAISRSSRSPMTDRQSFAEEEIPGIARREKLQESPSKMFSFASVSGLILSRASLISLLSLPRAACEAALNGLLIRFPSPSGEYIIAEVVDNKSSDTLTVRLDSGRLVKVPCASVSNSAPTDLEISTFAAVAGADRLERLVGSVSRKSAELEMARNFQAPADSGSGALELARLETELAIEMEKGTEISRISKLEADVSFLREKLSRDRAKSNKRGEALSAVNQRNRADQVLLDEAAAKLQAAAVSEEISGSMNPFKRRECAPTVMWDVGKTKIQGKSDFTQSIKNEISIQKTINLMEFFKNQSTQHNIDDLIVRAASDTRYQRAISSIVVNSNWPRNLNKSGDVMTFKEWKSRVANDS